MSRLMMAIAVCGAVLCLAGACLAADDTVKTSGSQRLGRSRAQLLFWTRPLGHAVWRHRPHGVRRGRADGLHGRGLPELRLWSSRNPLRSFLERPLHGLEGDRLVQPFWRSPRQRVRSVRPMRPLWSVLLAVPLLDNQDFKSRAITSAARLFRGNSGEVMEQTAVGRRQGRASFWSALCRCGCIVRPRRQSFGRRQSCENRFKRSTRGGR